ncbi:hypothetical protein LRF89_13135 [Halorhodospira sp. 9621]|uniref:hypothetical protein n=1 Tax=Halorhodospira sp. 9621 TaxID=2899135 RepID=UPI001EE8B236|nr:hypothetical protein [Halorhodospira sp. 9621]MCG5534376.1 hypothetical protein [Halorhodospira sp. 9621]
MSRRNESIRPLRGFEDAETFGAFCRDLLDFAQQANEQMNAFSGHLERDERSCRDARQTAYVAEHLQQRVMATRVELSLDPDGEHDDALRDLARTLYADQFLARELRYGISRHAAGISGPERREQFVAMSRILSARSQLYQAVEVLRLMLFEHEMDVRTYEDENALCLGASQALLRSLGWSGQAE